ncbi:MAG: type II toxin-antitoxin system ParD family antitoxin [Chloracidobacterium sp.]|nr:type II toxin-antitoxin system ParD family antitoxin [Chloracidobacterium sp.]
MIVKLSISMPKSLEDFARSRVRHDGYGSISEYFRELVRIDQRYDTAKRVQPEPFRSAPDGPLISFRNQNFENKNWPT